MSGNKADKPRTGTGFNARGRKPHTSELSMVNVFGDRARKQPRGWGIARVFDIVTGKERKK